MTDKNNLIQFKLRGKHAGSHDDDCECKVCGPVNFARKKVVNFLNENGCLGSERIEEELNKAFWFVWFKARKDTLDEYVEKMKREINIIDEDTE